MTEQDEVRARAPDPDATILDRMRRGDDEAFAELVDRWSPTMLRIARTYVSTRQSAEDAVQDAWVGVVRGLAGFEGRSSLRTWVFAILVNQARSRGVREARSVPMSELVHEGSGPTVDADRFRGPLDPYPDHWTPAGVPQQWEGHPEGRVLAGEALHLLEKALTGLPPRQCAVVTLRDVQGMTTDETCDAMGISPQNQRVLLHRGRAALRRALEEYYRLP